MVQYLVLLLACLLLNSCGKKGPLEPLEQSDYPRSYPKLPDSDTERLNKQKKATLS